MFIDGSCIYKLFLSANSYSKIFIFIWSHEHYNRQDPQDKPFEYKINHLNISPRREFRVININYHFEESDTHQNYSILHERRFPNFPQF